MTALTAARVRGIRLPAVWRRPLAIIGVVFVLGWVVIALIVPLLPIPDPLAQSFPELHAPTTAHPFGTDSVGRDQLSRTLWGSRVSLPARPA